MAASANLPALVLSLYCRRCNTAGVLAGIIGGTLLAISMVLVSPSMTYPLQQRAALQTQLVQLKQASDPVVQEKRHALEQQIQAIPDSASSLVGLQAPLITLSNPGIIPIPAGFILVIIFSLLFRDERALQRWNELAVRRELGSSQDQYSTDSSHVIH
ncbi:MAG: hypothetical protein XXXJIFNMEKO3_02296 [Candidatus Erwinia impunctatus]